MGYPNSRLTGGSALSNQTIELHLDLRDICVNSLSRDYSDNETNEKQQSNDDLFPSTKRMRFVWR